MQARSSSQGLDNLVEIATRAEKRFGVINPSSSRKKSKKKKKKGKKKKRSADDSSEDESDSDTDSNTDAYINFDSDFELQAHQGKDLQEFKKALKEEYFLEDSQRVTKQSFMKWIKQKNKGLSAQELLQEFEKRYDQLSAIEQQLTRLERVELFVQATDARLQKSLEQLLEDAEGELGLTSD
ncbi:hypothetical protein L7F22_056213 [Adiantum nelumboides]|nr:hypothetical protein [Adiantum nelumboides]